jgi:hypothetical protein
LAGEEIAVHRPIIDVFAYQEALLIEAVFGIALLTMLWVGFRRWLQHKERMGRLLAEETAERTARYRAQTDSVEARLKAVEQLVADGGTHSIGQIDALGKDASPDSVLKRD